MMQNLRWRDQEVHRRAKLGGVSSTQFLKALGLSGDARVSCADMWNREEVTAERMWEVWGELAAEMHG
jgi:hypothetical protein